MFGLNIGSQSGSQSTSRANNNGHNNQNGNNTRNKSTSDDQARFVQKYLTNCKSFYSCIYCRTHLANHDELVSRSFQGNRSRAYLFNSVINISCGPSVQRALNTGAHAVADIFCANCGTTMGWKYEKAYVDSQKYKEGKYIIELAHVVRENRHLEMDKRDMKVNMATSPSQANGTCRDPVSPGGTSLNNNHDNRWSTHSTSSSVSQDHDVIIDDRTVDDDDELMFPLYDDLMHLDRSTCPSFSSSILYDNKARRSFYLDSTPYDWKCSTYSTSDIEKNQPTTDNAATKSTTAPSQATRGSLASSSDTTSSSSPTSSTCSSLPSSSSSSSAGCPAACSPNQGATVGNSSRLPSGDVGRISAFQETLGPKAQTDAETQFEFEVEIDTDTFGPSTSCDRQQQITNGDSQHRDSSATNSVNMDDEKFYDCCTDHDVSTLPPL